MTNAQSKFILNTNMDDTVYTVTTYSHALCNPGYNESDPRWLEGLWGVYSSESDAENAVFSQILNEFGNYMIFNYDDISRDEFGDTQYASYESHERMRFEITHKDHGIPVIKSVVSIAESRIIGKEQNESTFEEKEESEHYYSDYSDYECIDNIPYNELTLEEQLIVNTKNEKYSTW